MRRVSFLLWFLLFVLCGAARAQVHVEITTPLPPPEWALLERELLRLDRLQGVVWFKDIIGVRGVPALVDGAVDVQLSLRADDSYTDIADISNRQIIGDPDPSNGKPVHCFPGRQKPLVTARIFASNVMPCETGW